MVSPQLSREVTSDHFRCDLRDWDPKTRQFAIPLMSSNIPCAKAPRDVVDSNDCRQLREFRLCRPSIAKNSNKAGILSDMVAPFASRSGPNEGMSTTGGRSVGYA